MILHFYKLKSFLELVPESEQRIQPKNIAKLSDLDGITNSDHKSSIFQTF